MKEKSRAVHESGNDIGKKRNNFYTAAFNHISESLD